MARPWEQPPDEYAVYKKNDILWNCLFNIITLGYRLTKKSPDLCKSKSDKPF